MKSIYRDKKLTELRKLCNAKGLNSEGFKNELITRLEDFDKTKPIDMFKQRSTQNLNEDRIIQPQTLRKLDIFYLQLKTSNVANYFNFGYIYPLALEESEIYKNENRSKDILSSFEEYIVMFNTNNVDYNEDEVLIEMVLNELSVKEYGSTGLFYISEPIPVSRIKAIYFRTTSLRETFLSSIKTFPDCFIPASICKVSSTNQAGKSIDLTNINLPSNESLNEWRVRLDKVDKLLGLFSFIKNLGVFTAERENRLEEYTASFMGALTLINPISSLSHYKENSFLKPLIQYQTVEVTNIQRQIFKSIIERVYANNEFSLNVAISLLDAIINSSSAKAEDLGELKEQLELFKQLDQLLISYKGFLARDNIKKHLPSLALLFLAKFSNKSRQNTDKQAVRISFIENEFNFPINITEYVLGFLGLYYGYKNMIKEDTNLRFEDKVFSRIAYNVQSIKFKLDSYFERFILESIFRYVVNQQKQLNNNFDFLQWDEVIRDNRSPFNLDSEEFEYSDHSFTVLGHKILRLERIDKTERVFQKIEMEYSDSIQDSSYLFAFFKKYFKLDKWYLLEILKKNKGRIRREELEKILELDKKHRN